MWTMGTNEHDAWLEAEWLRLLGFGSRLRHPLGGAAWLDEDGAPDVVGPVHTWITARMVHVYSLGVMRGVPGSADLADAALEGLLGPLRDREHGGWFASVAADGRAEGEAAKSCYAHAFVVLAASSATLAGRPGAADLLADALDVLDRRFWDDRAGMCVDEWDRTWTGPEDYRGLNGTMHAVEAMLAAADAGADPLWRGRALRVCRRVAELGDGHDWRLPEHFDEDWTPLLDFNIDHPHDPFKPFGATVGHGFEWARLLLHTEAACGETASDRIRDAAVALFDRATADGWQVDGEPGFVYTTGWDGRPVVRERLHWVVTEAIAAAAVLHRRTGEPRFADLYEQWWEYAEARLIDRDRGSWHHELDTTNRPAATVWPGKPDLYHAVQATLVPRLPLTPMLAAAVHAGAPG